MGLERNVTVVSIYWSLRRDGEMVVAIAVASSLKRSERDIMMDISAMQSTMG